MLWAVTRWDWAQLGLGGFFQPWCEAPGRTSMALSAMPALPSPSHLLQFEQSSEKLQKWLAGSGLCPHPGSPHLSVRAVLRAPVGGRGPALLSRFGLGALPAAVAVARVEALLFGGGRGVLLPLLGAATLLLLVLGRRLSRLGYWKENVG